MIKHTGDFDLELDDWKDPHSIKLNLIRRREMQPLKETGQGPGTAIGFFEQGIMVGALFIVLPVLSITGYTGWVLVRRFLLPGLAGGF